MEALIARLRAARSLFVLTGSGISAESGLPTFRGAGGLWRSRRVEELASPQGFDRDPLLVWTWYNQRLAAHRSARPNAGHDALARLETLSGDFTLATQNVDSLHLRAGSRRVLELHGNLREARCTDCGVRRHSTPTAYRSMKSITCGGRIRPCVVWFGESLPADVWAQAEQAAARADVILVVGTSAVVYPAAALATQYARGAYSGNQSGGDADERPVDLALRETAASALPRIVEALSRD